MNIVYYIARSLLAVLTNYKSKVPFFVSDSGKDNIALFGRY